MGEVHGSSINIAAAEESSPGVLSGGTWINLEADAVDGAGPQYTKQARNPFSVTRQLRRPFVAGLDCALTLNLDAIKDHVDFLMPHAFKSVWKHSGGTEQSFHRPSAVVDGGGSEDSFTVAADGDYPNGSLIYTRGFTNDENNGLFVTTGGSTTTAVKVATGTLVAEADPPDNATLDFVGFQFSSGDLELDADGNFISTTKDLTTLGLNVDQIVYLPGPEDVDPPYRFANDDYYGFAQVVSVSTNLIELRRRGWTVGAADDGSGKTIHLYFTKWIRNVPRSHDDENEGSLSIEITYPRLGPANEDGYEYCLGYALNDVTFQMDAEAKITMEATFIGRTASDPTLTRESGPEDALDCVTGLAMATGTDVTRLEISDVDEEGLYTDFQTMSLVLGNNINPHKAVGHLGNRFAPIGDFTAMINSTAYFVRHGMIGAVRDNRILRFMCGGRNQDFGMVFDVPSSSAMTSAKTISKTELVSINSEVSGFMDAESGYTAALSVFGYLPTQAPGTET